MNTDKTPLENESQPSCLGDVSGSVLSELSFRKVDETYYTSSGEKIHNSDSYFLEKHNYTIQLRLFINKPEILIWIKYNFNGNVNLSAENLKFYENQHIKRVETMPIEGLLLLIKALTGDELSLS
jgi:CRISPR/Cas system-associated protein Cas5 (RAMP superfamily)